MDKSVNGQGMYEVAMIGGFTLLYLLLPTANSSSDAFGYAAVPNTGPHHLLYDKLCILTLQLCQGNAVWNLSVLKALNALFAGGVLWLSMLLLRHTRPSQPFLPWILLLGSMFGLMRFATENETYIIPVFLSLVGTYYLQGYQSSNDRRQLITAFTFLTIAVLFHQIHVFWWLAAMLLLIRRKKISFSVLAIPFSGTVFILGVYIFTAVQQEKELIPFILGDAVTEAVQLSPGIDNFKFTVINFVRSFVQIHGNISLFFSAFFLVRCLLIIAIVLVLTGIYFFFREKPKKYEISRISKCLELLLFSAFLLHLGFAWYSVGNAEFMVMLPLLLLLYVAIKWAFSVRSLWFLGAGFLLWNLTGAIVPSCFLSFENVSTNAEKMKGRPGIFIAHNQTLLHNYYLYAISDAKLRAVDDAGLENYLLKSPADIADDMVLRNAIDTALKLLIPVYTDCVDYPVPTSRKSMLNGDKNRLFFAPYHLMRYDSFTSFYGKVIIHRVMAKSQSYALNRRDYLSVPCGLPPGDK